MSDTRPALRCFDLDGCIVVSDAAIGDALEYALDVVGLPAPAAERLRAAIGPPLITTIDALLREAGHDTSGGEGAELRATAVTAYRARYAAIGFGLTRPVPGVVALLEQLRALASGPTVIVTAKPVAVAEPLLEQLGLRDLFDAVHGVSLGPAVEEKRVTLARALAEADVAPQRAVMIGDRSHDIVAGRACGTRTVGVLWGAGDRTELEAAGADLVVADPVELVPELLSSGWSAGR